MIDWFVLLIPLLVLPIVLLLVFVGCVLDREGTATHGAVHFAYEPGLPDDIQQFSVTIAGTLITEDGGVEVFSGSVERGGSAAEIDGAGEASIPVGQLAFANAGPMTCSGTALTQPANPPFNEETTTIQLDKTKTKLADELPPTFTLVKDGDGNIAIV